MMTQEAVDVGTRSRSSNELNRINDYIEVPTSEPGLESHSHVVSQEQINESLMSKKLTITWTDINVHATKSPNKFVQLKNLFTCQKGEGATRKQIINNVSGIARPNEVMAILGSSGSGKTTLLNVLNSRNKGKLNVQGDIRVNGELIRSTEMIASVSGYVQQDEMFISSLKVREHLIFQAMLRMDKNTTKQDRMKRVEEVLIELNLKKCENTVIGNPERGIKGISGGERRRLTFASEVITNPSILFCDEPTSGLDSYMAMTLVDCMKNLAKQNKTIICTIHQPSSELFEMFDRLCILSEGRLAFLGDPAHAFEFFDMVGHGCPPKFNPADHYIKTLSVIPFEVEACHKRIHEICDGFEKSPYNQKLNEEIQAVNNDEHQENVFLFLEKQFDSYKANIFTQIRWLLWRNMIDLIRNPLALRILAIQSLVMAVLYGLIYFRLELNQEGVQNMNGVLFLCIVNSSFGALFAVLNTFPSEIPIFLREHQNRMYRVLSYYISKSLIELPNHFVLPFVFTSIFYWMTNLNNDVGKFFIFGGIIIAVAQTSLAYGQFISVAAPTNAASTDLAGPLTVPMMIFSGYFINNASIPKYFLWLKYLSWFGYANEALVVNQWSGVKNIKCDTLEALCFLDGETIMDYLNIKTEDFTYNLCMLGTLIIGWRILSFLVLLIKSNKA